LSKNKVPVKGKRRDTAAGRKQSKKKRREGKRKNFG